MSIRTEPARHAVVVLPPNETFSPQACGAIGLIVERLAAAPGQFRTTIVGTQPAGAPFASVAFAGVARAKRPLGRTGVTARRMAAAVARLAPDLIEVHNHPPLALHLAARFPSIPVTLFLHNDPQTIRGARSPQERARLVGRLARVAAVSDLVAKRMTEGVPPGPWPPPVVLPNAIDLAAMPAPRPQADRAREILFAGRIVAEKGADAFVAACAEALPRLPGWTAAMIGARRLRPGRPGAFERRVRRAAAEAGIAFHGYQPHDAVMAALDRAAIAVVPSRWPEPFGLIALEAMAAGAALVCSPFGNLPSLAGGAAILADPGQPGALAEALVRLALDLPERARLAQAGRARAKDFDLALAVRRLDALREDMLTR